VGLSVEKLAPAKQFLLGEQRSRGAMATKTGCHPANSTATVDESVFRQGRFHRRICFALLRRQLFLPGGAGCMGHHNVVWSLGMVTEGRRSLVQWGHINAPSLPAGRTSGQVWSW
jgi:hypothetical protein